MAQERLEFVVSAKVSEAIDGLDRVGKEMKKLGRDVMEVTGMLTGIGAVLTANAAKFSDPVKRAVDNVTNAYNVLSVRIATALIPAIGQLEQFINRLISAWDALTPKQKAFVSDAAVMVVKIAAIGAAISSVGKVAEMFGGMGQAIRGMLTPAGLVTGAILGIAAAVIITYGAVKQLANFKGPIAAAAATAKLPYARDTLDAIRAEKSRMEGLGASKELLSGNKRYQELEAGEKAQAKYVQELKEAADQTFDFASLVKTATAGLGGFGEMVDGLVTKYNGAGAGHQDVIDTLDAQENDPLKAKVMAGKDTVQNFALAIAQKEKEAKELSTQLAEKYAAFNFAQQDAIEKAQEGLKEMASDFAVSMAHDKVYFDTAQLQAGLEDMAKRIRLDMQQGVDPSKVTKAWGKSLDAMAETGHKIKEASEKMAAGIMAATQSGLSALGRAGQIVQAGISGFQSGGWWGAIIAVFAEIIKDNKKFAKVIEMSNAFTKKLAEGLNGLVEGIIPLLAAVNDVSLVIMKSLQPVFLIVGRLLQAIVPSLNVINQVLDVLVGIVNNLVGDLLGMGDAFNIVGIVANILKAETLMLVAVIASSIAGIIGAAGQLTIGFAYLVAGVARIVGAMGIDTTGLVNLTMGILGAGQKLIGTASGLQKQAEGWGDESKYIWKHINEGGIDAGNSLGNLADVADSLSESLTNVPTGYRIKGTQFNSSDAIGGASGPQSIDITIDGELAALVRAVRSADMRVNFNMSGATVQQRAAAAGF